MSAIGAASGHRRMRMFRSAWRRGHGYARQFAPILVRCVYVACPPPAQASEWREAEWDWRAGDLIFRSGLDPLDDLIAQATRTAFGSVAIVRAGSGAPHVVYVDPENGVTETLLDDFISGLGADDYAAYRVRNMADWGQGDSPVSYNALLVAYGHAADRFRLVGGDAYYGAEMVYLAALGAGVALASPVMLSDLAEGHPEIREAFLTDWQDHPYCTYVASREGCWDVIKGTAIVTTGGILESPGLEKLYPLAE